MENNHKMLSSTLFAEGMLQGLGMSLYTLRHSRGEDLKTLSAAIGESTETIEKLELGQFGLEEPVDFDIILKIIEYYNAKLEMTAFI